MTRGGRRPPFAGDSPATSVAVAYQEHGGGEIMVDTGTNGGSVFRIGLPMATAATTEHDDHASQRRGGHT
jgi:hypothetical protein